MTHPLVLALFDDATAAAAAASHLRDLGIPRERVSIVAKSHDAEVELARTSGGSPGSEIEDSLPASRLGELSGHLIAALALIMPGIGPIVAGGPLAADFGEAAGHLVGGLVGTLERAGVPPDEAKEWERRIEEGAVLVGAHVDPAGRDTARQVFEGCGASALAEGAWKD